MHDKGSVMLRLLLNRYGGGEKETLLKALPEEDVQKILSVPIESGDIKPFLKNLREAIQHIHYSWLISPLQTVQKEKLPLILSLLPDSHSSKLRQVLNETSNPLRLSPHARAFLTSQLYRTFKLEEVLPFEYLPESEMTPLVHMQKRELLDLIDYLGLYDLAEEIQHIVDKHLLEQIYSCLPKKKKKFLHVCLHQKEKLITQRLQLEYWDGNCIKLNKLLHHKGMVRLGYALSGQHEDLFWHITHILDTGRGKKLFRYYSQEAIAGITKSLMKQVKKVIAFFKQESKM